MGCQPAISKSENPVQSSIRYNRRMLSDPLKVNLADRFSEDTYAFAFLNEIQHYSPGYRFVPYYLSRQQEYSRGFDVYTNHPIFQFYLQFKRSKVRVGHNGKAYKYFKKKYYQFDLHRNHNYLQHNNLVKLERRMARLQKQPGVGIGVFYVAPFCTTHQDLAANSQNSEVIKESIFVKPSVIGGFNADYFKRHIVAFATDGQIRRCSRPKMLEYSSFSELMPLIEKKASESTSLALREDIMSPISKVFMKAWREHKDKTSPYDFLDSSTLRSEFQIARENPYQAVASIAWRLFNLRTISVYRDETD